MITLNIHDKIKQKIMLFFSAFCFFAWEICGFYIIYLKNQPSI